MDYIYDYIYQNSSVTSSSVVSIPANFQHCALRSLWRMSEATRKAHRRKIGTSPWQKCEIGQPVPTGSQLPRPTRKLLMVFARAVWKGRNQRRCSKKRYFLPYREKKEERRGEGIMSFPAVCPPTACLLYLLARSALSGNAPLRRGLRRKKKKKGKLAEERNYPSLSARGEHQRSRGQAGSFRRIK